MSILRWQFTDPYDANSATRSYRFPRNPREMTTLNPDRAVQAQMTTAGKVLLFEGATPPKEFQFSGPILEKGHFLELQKWTYTKKRRIIITDHLGRDISCVLTNCDMVPKRRPNIYYSHEYTVSGLALSVSAVTAPEFGFGTVATP